jgi:putative Holliday junction resolvase
MRTLGLDVGDRRIGIAVSDPEGRLAMPVRTYERGASEKRDAAALAELARAEAAERIVVGLPLSLSGERGPQAEAAEAFAERLRAAGADVVLYDERLSSREADHHLRASGRKGKAAKAARDAIAASIILQAYLDSQRHGALPPLPPIE